MAMVIDDIDGLDDVAMLEGRAYTEFSGDLFLIFLFGFVWTLWTKLLDCIDVSAVLTLDETDGATCAAAEDFAPLAVLFGDMGMGSIEEGRDGVVRGRGRGSILALPDGGGRGREMIRGRRGRRWDKKALEVMEGAMLCRVGRGASATKAEAGRVVDWAVHVGEAIIEDGGRHGGRDKGGLDKAGLESTAGVHPSQPMCIAFSASRYIHLP